MKMDTDIIMREFVFADIGISDEIHTDLPLGEVLNTFKEFGLNKIASDENKGKMQLRNNFAVKINTSKFYENNSFTLEFSRYYHRFYFLYITAALLLSFYVEFTTPGVKPGFTFLVISMIPLILISLSFELVRGIKNIKAVDYSKEADRFFLEISNAIREKENAHSNSAK